MSGSGSRRWLVLGLEAPLVAFGGVTIDHIGVTWDFPALSMLTGLFANALGWDRTEVERHQALQDRLVFAARRDSVPYIGVLRDMQNADLSVERRGWTTRGKPEERGGGSLDQVHRRQRDYHPDALIAVVVTLARADDAPTLDDLAAAVERPQRPLFIGRKPCLPSAPLLRRLFDGGSFIESATAHEALSSLPRLGYLDQDRDADLQDQRVELPAIWPAAEGPTTGATVDRGIARADRRNWVSGLHGGTRAVVEGRIRPPPGPGSTPEAAP
jgi:CRISPR system Cascade subunit CasD